MVKRLTAPLAAATLVAAFLVAVVWAATGGLERGFLDSSPSAATTEVVGETSSEPMPDSAPEPAAPAHGLSMTVSHVHDGDTLFLIAGDGTREKVRLIGLDTPELQPNEECYAVAARDYLRQLTPDGSVVTVAADIEAHDRYGRSLYYLWTTDGTFVNLKLVTEGYGSALVVEPNSAYAGQLIAAEGLARSAGGGMWSQC